MSMPLSHAKTFQEGNVIMPKEGETCSNACFFATWCASFEAGTPCKGFKQLSNGKISRHIQNLLREEDLIYAESCGKLAQQTDDPQTREIMVKEVLRFLTPEPVQRNRLPLAIQPMQAGDDSNVVHRGFGEGLKGMLDAAFPNSREEEKESPHVPTTGFGRMLEAAELGGRQNTIQSTIISQKEKAVNRNFGGGFKGMLNAISGEGRMLDKDNPYIASKPSKSESFSWMKRKEDEADEAFLVEKIKEMEVRILKQISESLSPKKPKRREKKQQTATYRGFGGGLRGMLDAISGRERIALLAERSTQESIPVGFRAQLDVIFSSPREKSVVTVEPLEEGETILFQRGLFGKGSMTRKGKKFITAYIPA
jgi:hypothetical protein